MKYRKTHLQAAIRGQGVQQGSVTMATHVILLNVCLQARDKKENAFLCSLQHFPRNLECQGTVLHLWTKFGTNKQLLKFDLTFCLVVLLPNFIGSRKQMALKILNPSYNFTEGWPKDNTIHF